MLAFAIYTSNILVCISIHLNTYTIYYNIIFIKLDCILMCLM